jgi:hypothetical protein
MKGTCGARLAAAARCAAPTAVALTVFASAMPAHAVLGASVASLRDDQSRLKATRQAVVTSPGAVGMHEMTLADGSSIREYVNPNGIVFAVSWSTRLKPRLAPLLGQYATSYASAAGAAAGRRGIQRKVVLQEGDLVVHATAHLNAYVGTAYLRSLVPDGVSADVLR